MADPVAKKEWDDAREEERVDEEVVSEGAVRAGATATTTANEGAGTGASAKKRGPGRPRKV